LAHDLLIKNHRPAPYGLYPGPTKGLGIQQRR